MTTKTATVLIRTEPETKAAADMIFERIGTSTSGAINIFLHKAVETGGFPFEVKLSKPDIPDEDALSKAKIAELLDSAYDETLKNGGAPLRETLEKLNHKYGFAADAEA